MLDGFIILSFTLIEHTTNATLLSLNYNAFMHVRADVHTCTYIHPHTHTSYMRVASLYFHSN